MVVLLLSVAVQSRNNELIIAAITGLDYEAQRDIMFFIESTLAKVKSHAIVAGTFTSGMVHPMIHNSLLIFPHAPIWCIRCW